ncbi:uncharacterized protein DS421_17g588940 [Arachis hypogaea]|nr:uncharacterized protein DS421_17g588940 [Arachis hypogaea]
MERKKRARNRRERSRTLHRPIHRHRRTLPAPSPPFHGAAAVIHALLREARDRDEGDVVATQPPSRRQCRREENQSRGREQRREGERKPVLAVEGDSIVAPSRCLACHHRRLTAATMETERRRSSCRNLGVCPIIEEDRDEGEGAVNAAEVVAVELPRFLWSKSPLMENMPLRSRASISRQSRQSYHGCCCLTATEGSSPPIHPTAEDELCLLLLPTR